MNIKIYKLIIQCKKLLIVKLQYFQITKLQSVAKLNWGDFFWGDFLAEDFFIGDNFTRTKTTNAFWKHILKSKAHNQSKHGRKKIFFPHDTKELFVQHFM